MRRFILLLLLIGCRGGSGDDDDDVVEPDAQPGVGCAAADPRTPATQTFVGPTGLEDRALAFIDAAQDTLDIQMYLFTIDEITARIIAAHQRGVAVRVLLDKDEAGNVDTKATLAGAGVPVQDDPAMFPFAPAKYLIADGATAIVMSANFNYGATSTERNYGTVLSDPDDLADLQAIFDSDWTGQGFADLDCTRLIVSPVNARQRILQLIGGTDATLDLSVAYMSDSTVRIAVTEAHDRGVAVRVLLADDAGFPENADTALTLANGGIDVRILRTSVDLHAKLIFADGVDFVGSQNLSPTSLNDNREVGVLVTESAAVAPLQTQLDADWSAGSAP
jgi:phosphatidylserine/phosphatidylglycerophosphate/cardiolipin synthase-like enzyme